MIKAGKAFWGMLLLCILLCTAAQGAWAADFDGVMLVDAQTGATLHWYEDKGVHYFFLPAGWENRNIQVHFSGVESIAVEDGVLTPGMDASVFVPGERVTLTAGKKKYTVMTMRSSNLSALFLATESGTLDAIHKSKHVKEPGALTFYRAEGSVIYDDALEHIKTRGNASFNFDKKSYTIKLENAEALSGTIRAKRWVLTSNHRDKSMLRNWITLDMARAAGLAHTPVCEMVDVYINSDYLGTYLLSESIEINEGRVDIADLEKATQEANEASLDSYDKEGPSKAKAEQGKYYDIPEDPQDITGGYLLEYEAYPARYEQEPSAYATAHGAVVAIKDPEYVSRAQMEYISGVIQRFENAIYAADGIDPDTGKHYTQMADMDSLVRKYLVEEVSKNYDGNTSSQYFYKPEGEEALLHFGPVWDYDSAYGGYAREAGMSVVKPTRLYIGTSSQEKHWWPKLYAHEEFAQAAAQTYREVFAPLLSQLLGQEEGVLQPITDYAAYIADSAAMNDIRWPYGASTKNDVIREKGMMANANILADFIEKRKAFLDETWAK